jgi:hypothetical protein
MNPWDYLTLDLSDLPKRANLFDALNATGKEGWELVAITLNNIAIFKRPSPLRAGSRGIGKAKSAQDNRTS